MTKANVGSLLVFDASKLDLSSSTDVKPSGDAVEGIVTERGQGVCWRRILAVTQTYMATDSLEAADYLTKVAVRSKSSKEVKVEEIMTERSKLMTVDPHHSTMDAMTMMIKHNFRHVPVVRPCPFHPLSLFPAATRTVAAGH